MSENIEIKVKITGDICEDPELLDAYSRRLREELMELDVDSVEYADQEDAPKGSKGVGAAVGDMIFSLAPLDYAVSSVVGAVQSFVSRGQQCNVTLDIGGNSITIQDTTPEQQQKLIDAWIKSVSEQQSVE